MDRGAAACPRCTAQDQGVKCAKCKSPWIYTTCAELDDAWLCKMCVAGLIVERGYQFTAIMLADIVNANRQAEFDREEARKLELAMATPPVKRKNKKRKGAEGGLLGDVKS